jgi:hypothetical protein
MELMKYDRDLRFIRWLFIGLALSLVANAAFSVRTRTWSAVLSSLLWTVCCLSMVASCKSQQRTRDEVRIAQAGIRALIELGEE